MYDNTTEKQFKQINDKIEHVVINDKEYKIGDPITFMYHDGKVWTSEITEITNDCEFYRVITLKVGRFFHSELMYYIDMYNKHKRIKS